MQRSNARKNPFRNLFGKGSKNNLPDEREDEQEDFGLPKGIELSNELKELDRKRKELETEAQRALFKRRITGVADIEEQPKQEAAERAKQEFEEKLDQYRKTVERKKVVSLNPKVGAGLTLILERHESSKDNPDEAAKAKDELTEYVAGLNMRVLTSRFEALNRNLERAILSKNKAITVKALLFEVLGFDKTPSYQTFIERTEDLRDLVKLISDPDARTLTDDKARELEKIYENILEAFGNKEDLKKSSDPDEEKTRSNRYRINKKEYDDFIELTGEPLISKKKAAIAGIAAVTTAGVVATGAALTAGKMMGDVMEFGGKAAWKGTKTSLSFTESYFKSLHLGQGISDIGHGLAQVVTRPKNEMAHKMHDYGHDVEHAIDNFFGYHPTPNAAGAAAAGHGHGAKGHGDKKSGFFSKMWNGTKSFISGTARRVTKVVAMPIAWTAGAVVGFVKSVPGMVGITEVHDPHNPAPAAGAHHESHYGINGGILGAIGGVMQTVKAITYDAPVQGYKHMKEAEEAAVREAKEKAKTDPKIAEKLKNTKTLKEEATTMVSRIATTLEKGWKSDAIYDLDELITEANRFIKEGDDESLEQLLKAAGDALNTGAAGWSAIKAAMILKKAIAPANKLKFRTIMVKEIGSQMLNLEKDEAVRFFKQFDEEVQSEFETEYLTLTSEKNLKEKDAKVLENQIRHLFGIKIDPNKRLSAAQIEVGFERLKAKFESLSLSGKAKTNHEKMFSETPGEEGLLVKIKNALVVPGVVEKIYENKEVVEARGKVEEAKKAEEAKAEELKKAKEAKEASEAAAKKAKEELDALKAAKPAEAAAPAGITKEDLEKAVREASEAAARKATEETSKKVEEVLARAAAEEKKDREKAEREKADAAAKKERLEKFKPDYANLGAQMRAGFKEKEELVAFLANLDMRKVVAKFDLLVSKPQFDSMVASTTTARLIKQDINPLFGIKNYKPSSADIKAAKDEIKHNLGEVGDLPKDVGLDTIRSLREINAFLDNASSLLTDEALDKIYS